MMNARAQRPLPESAIARIRPARSILPAVAAAEARQRQLRLVHSQRLVVYRRPSPIARLRQQIKLLGLLLALGAVLVLALDALVL